MPRPKHTQARPQPNGNDCQSTDASGNTSKVQPTQAAKAETEAAPHAASSYHDPDKHKELIDGLNASLKQAQESLRALRRKIMKE